MSVQPEFLSNKHDFKHYFFTRLSKIACLNSGMLLYINIV